MHMDINNYLPIYLSISISIYLSIYLSMYIYILLLFMTRVVRHLQVRGVCLEPDLDFVLTHSCGSMINGPFSHTYFALHKMRRTSSLQ
jgi:hypothetical protein